jgi:hypothetical protein
MHPDNKLVSFVVITASYLRFSYAFRQRRESATFLLATMVASDVSDRLDWVDVPPVVRRMAGDVR